MTNAIKWMAIAGSWRIPKRIQYRVERDVRKRTERILEENYGIVSGGALGVDYLATDEALNLNPEADRIRIFLPASLETYINHYKKRAKQGVITREQAERLLSQLEKIATTRRDSIIEIPENKVVNKKTYYQRIDREIDFSDELTAFHINESGGTGYTIDRALEKGIPVWTLIYNI